MMKKLILISGVLAGICLCAQTDGQKPNATPLLRSDMYQAYGKIEMDGDDWLQFSMLEKLTYLRGTQDAVLDAQWLIYGLRKQQDDVHVLDVLNFSDITLGEVSAALSEFYTNRSNVHVPILVALQWVKLRFKGASTLELNAEAARLRSMFVPKRGK
jgi:hypothetical protein